MVFNTTFNNITVILWWSVLLVKETQSIWRKPPTCYKSLTNFITIMLYHTFKKETTQTCIYDEMLKQKKRNIISCFMYSCHMMAVFLSIVEGHICQLMSVSNMIGAVVVMIVWQLDLQLPMQSVPIITKVVSLNPVDGEMYSIQHYCDQVFQ